MKKDLQKAGALAVLLPLATIAMLSAPAPVLAASTPITMPAETRLVQFRYDPNRTYEILTRPDAATDIVLEPGEKLKALAIGDTIQWVTADTDGHIFVKPIRPDLFTAGTIVTDKRAYQISLRSSKPEGNWYQRVSWAYSDNLLVKSIKEDKSAAWQPKSTIPTSGDIKGLNFNYTIDGEKSIVKQVFDDGKTTWIAVDKHAESLPALFVDNGSGLEIANYHVEGDYIVVHSRFRKAVLKLADNETVIKRSVD